MAGKKFGLIVLIALAICGGVFAYTYTTGFLTIDINEPGGELATLIQSGNQPDWESLTEGEITVCNDVPTGDLYLITPAENYTGDLVVKVSIINTDALIKAYQYLNLKLYIEGSEEAAESPNHRLLTLDNAMTTFNIESPFSGTYTLSVTGGSYCLTSDDSDEWAAGWSATPQIHCEAVQR